MKLAFYVINVSILMPTRTTISGIPSDLVIAVAVTAEKMIHGRMI